MIDYHKHRGRRRGGGWRPGGLDEWIRKRGDADQPVRRPRHIRGHTGTLCASTGISARPAPQRRRDRSNMAINCSSTNIIAGIATAGCAKGAVQSDQRRDPHRRHTSAGPRVHESDLGKVELLARSLGPASSHRLFLAKYARPPRVCMLGAAAPGWPDRGGQPHQIRRARPTRSNIDDGGHRLPTDRIRVVAGVQPATPSAIVLGRLIVKLVVEAWRDAAGQLMECQIPAR